MAHPLQLMLAVLLLLLLLYTATVLNSPKHHLLLLPANGNNALSVFLGVCTVFCKPLIGCCHSLTPILKTDSPKMNSFFIIKEI